MKTERNHLDFIESQSGSMVMQVLIVAIMLTIVAGAVMGYISRQNTVHALRKVTDEADNLQTLLSMALSVRGTCSQNLSSQYIGQNVASLNPNHSVKIAYGPNAADVISPGGVFESIKIRNAYFQAPKQVGAVIAGVTSYTTELTVEVQDPLDKNPSTFKKINVLLYMIDVNGSLKECLSTAYADPQPANAPAGARFTVEDVMCTQYKASMDRIGTADVAKYIGPFPIWIFLPYTGHRTCVPYS